VVPLRRIALSLAVTPGTRLVVYEVTAQIGEDAIGHVYRVRDTKLARDVAIKILPEAFAHDSDRPHAPITLLLTPRRENAG
jgi:hypothetical protein